MKNYYFDPNNYNLEFIVLANSAEEALEFLKVHLKTQETDFHDECYEKWKDSTIQNLPFEYSVREFELGQVIETERS